MDVHDWLGRRTCAVLLFLGSSLHNLEEAVTFERYRPAAQNLVRNATGRQIDLPDASTFQLALAMVTTVAAGCLLYAASGNASRGKERMLRLVALVLLVNVFVPHVPAAFALGGYTPGLVTAVILNLPLACLVLFRLRVTKRLTGSSATDCVGAALYGPVDPVDSYANSAQPLGHS